MVTNGNRLQHGAIAAHRQAADGAGRAATSYRVPSLDAIDEIRGECAGHRPVAAGLRKAVGVGLGALGVLVLYQPGAHSGTTSGFRLFFLLAIAASLLRALWGLVLKASSLAMIDP